MGYEDIEQQEGEEGGTVGLSSDPCELRAYAPEFVYEAAGTALNEIVKAVNGAADPTKTLMFVAAILEDLRREMISCPTLSGTERSLLCSSCLPTYNSCRKAGYTHQQCYYGIPAPPPPPYSTTYSQCITNCIPGLRDNGGDDEQSDGQEQAA